MTRYLATSCVAAATCFAACSSTHSTPSNGEGSSGSPSTTGASASLAATGSTGSAGSSATTSGASSTASSATSGASGSSSSASSAASSSGTGSGGTASSSASGTSGGLSTEGGAGSGTGFFTDGFESDAVGSQPTGFGNLVDYIQNGANPNSSGDLALVDTTHVHGGAHAVHFHVSGQNPSFLTYALPTGTNTLYLRAWVYLSRQLGDNTASQNDNHETLIALNGSPGNVNTEARFGAIKGTIGVNAVPSDNITPLQASWNGPPSIPATTWVCLEIAFLGAPAQNELHVWMNDADLFDVTTPAQWQNGTIPMNWLSGLFSEVDFGWQSFSGFGADVWVDDLVLGNDRIGCN